ncbi:accessory gene regulator B family protein [Paenibacillus tarimensis]
MLKTLSKGIAARIKESAPDHPASAAVLQYSISFILNAVVIIVLSILISLFTGRTTDVLIALFIFALLRQISGGFHLKSGTACVVVSVAAANILPFIQLNNTGVLVSTIISMILVIFFAPSRIEKQTKIPKSWYPMLKMIALIIVGSNLLIKSDIIACTVLLQSITLITRR